MPTRAIKVWNQSASAWENVGIEAPAGGGLDAATASATYLRQDTASATYLPISASSNYLFSSTASATYLTQANASATYLPISASSTFGGGGGFARSFLLGGM